MTRSPGRRLAAAAVLAACAASPLVAQNCVNSFATFVDSSNTAAGGSNQGTPASNALGDTPSTDFSLGDRGYLTVGFSGNFSNSGNSADDLCVDEVGNVDCYTVWLFPANSFTAGALAAAGWRTQNVGGTTVYEIPRVQCGDVNFDFERDVPGYGAGALQFTKVLIEDDGDGGNGAEIARVEVKFVCTGTTPPVSCVDGYATFVDAANTIAGVNQGGTPTSNALGDTPSDWYRLGRGGQITVGFDGPFSNSGDSSPDFYVGENQDNECYWICLFPSNAATASALAAAGWPAFVVGGVTVYQYPRLICGNEDVDIDAEVGGFAQGALTFDKLMVEDDGGTTGNGAEVILVRVYYICTPLVVCVSKFADSVGGFATGPNTNGAPADALGDTPGTDFSMGANGWIVVGYVDAFSTDGTSAADLFVDEVGTADCYTVRVFAGDAGTASILNLLQPANFGAFFEIATAYCGDASIDLDAFMGGAQNLRFSAVRIADNGAAATNDGVDVARVQAHFVCGAGAMPDCGPAFASTVSAAAQGATPNAMFPTAAHALGNSPTTGFSLGVGGSLELCFPNVFTTNGDARGDLFVDEYNAPDCYGVAVRPADGVTLAATIAAGLFDVGGGFYGPAQLFCGDQDVDLDAFVPGFAGGALHFDCVRIIDDGSAGDGSEILRVRAELVCAVARIRGFVYTDPECDGVAPTHPYGVAGTPVKLLDATGTVVLQTMNARADGSYEFLVMPGTYVVQVMFDGTLYTLAPQFAGSDPSRDSDVSPPSGATGAIVVAAGQVKEHVDALLCFPCPGPAAFVNTALPACGDPLDPVLTVTTPYLGTTFTATVTSQFPNAILFFFITPAAPTPWVYPGSPCTIYLDLQNLFLLYLEPTDPAGHWTRSVTIPPVLALAGFELTIQARICYPPLPSPIPGLTDWPSNAAHIKLGCP